MNANALQVNESLIHNISQVIESSQQQLRTAVNSAMVLCYWEIGRLIVEEEQNGSHRAEYGKKQLQQIAKGLTDSFGKGFDITNLRKMRLFYQLFPIRDTLCLELNWSHYRRLLRVDNEQARNWYIQETKNNHWSVRALDRQINVLYYERLLASQQPESIVQEANQKTNPLQETIHDYLRDPYILDFLNLQDKTYQESTLEEAIINHLQKFLLELGKGFAFVERQQRIRFEDEDFYIDLVFYNFKLKCFLLIDLKLGKLKHQDVGQMDTYIRLYDQTIKGSDDNPTIGLVLCSEKSEAVVKYSVVSDKKQLFASKYFAHLPTETELKQILQTNTQTYLSDAQ